MIVEVEDDAAVVARAGVGARVAILFFLSPAADPRVDMITFTGSTATGRAILAAGASTVKKTLLELGGKSAHIVLDDAEFNSGCPWPR